MKMKVLELNDHNKERTAQTLLMVLKIYFFLDDNLDVFLFETTLQLVMVVVPTAVC